MRQSLIEGIIRPKLNRQTQPHRVTIRRIDVGEARAEGQPCLPAEPDRDGGSSTGDETAVQAGLRVSCLVNGKR